MLLLLSFNFCLSAGLIVEKLKVKKKVTTLIHILIALLSGQILFHVFTPSLKGAHG